MNLDLSPLPEPYRSRVRRVYDRATERAREDARLAAAYDRLLPEHGYPNTLDEVAEAFGVSAARVRRAKWPGGSTADGSEPNPSNGLE